MVKICFVPNCPNSSKTTPTKIFITVPKNVKIRKKWFTAARRDVNTVTTAMYCCEDHFNLQDDMENYWQYHYQGGRVLLKTGVVPYKFKCQGRQTEKKRPLSEKRALKRKLEELLAETAPAISTGAVAAEQYHLFATERDDLLETAYIGKLDCFNDLEPQGCTQKTMAIEPGPQEVGYDIRPGSSKKLQSENTQSLVPVKYRSITTTDASVYYRSKSKAVDVSLPLHQDMTVSPFHIKNIDRQVVVL